LTLDFLFHGGVDIVFATMITAKIAWKLVLNFAPRVKINNIIFHW
jgi:hypothetical protein